MTQAAILCGMASPSFAATEDDLRELREQLRQFKEQYEKRIGAPVAGMLRGGRPA